MAQASQNHRNINDIYDSLLFNLDGVIVMWGDVGKVDEDRISKLNDTIRTYKTARDNCGIDTSIMDDNINKIMKQVPAFAKHIGYKPIN